MSMTHYPDGSFALMKRPHPIYNPVCRGEWSRIHPYDSFKRRVIEAWWVLTGKWSLHAAWQSGYDQHIQDESARLRKAAALTGEEARWFLF